MNQSTKLKKRKARIWVTDEVTRQLVVEFNTSGNTILVALKLYTDSELSKKIRKRAMELMEETTKNNQALITEYDQD